MASKLKTKTPLDGSLAKACTDVKTPERTRNVPKTLKLKAIIASKTVHPRKALRRSLTACT
jgi:hypothetical protein